MNLPTLSIKNTKAHVPVDGLKNLAKVGFRVDVAQLGNDGKTVAAEAAVAKVLEIVLLVAATSPVDIEVAGWATVLPKGIAESLCKAFFAKVVHEYCQSATCEL